MKDLMRIWIEEIKRSEEFEPTSSERELYAPWWDRHVPVFEDLTALDVISVTMGLVVVPYMMLICL